MRFLCVLALTLICISPALAAEDFGMPFDRNAPAGLGESMTGEANIADFLNNITPAAGDDMMDAEQTDPALYYPDHPAMEFGDEAVSVEIPGAMQAK